MTLPSPPEVASRLPISATGRHRSAPGGSEPEIGPSVPTSRVSSAVYAIVRAGGRQEKVSVGDVLVIDKLEGSR